MHTGMHSPDSRGISEFVDRGKKRNKLATPKEPLSAPCVLFINQQICCFESCTIHMIDSVLFQHSGKSVDQAVFVQAVLSEINLQALESTVLVRSFFCICFVLDSFLASCHTLVCTVKLSAADDHVSLGWRK